MHFHALRHTGKTLAAATGASTKELMTRMGHSTARAALIYQHAGAERERLIGDAVSAFVERARQQDHGPDGRAGGTRG
ncbi:integrase [Streptomyces sp. SPB162]|nr:integrase [Streptomyces sp. SPB162]